MERGAQSSLNEADALRPPPAIVDDTAEEFARKPERPGTEGCARQPQASGGMRKALWKWGIGASGRSQKVSITCRLDLQFVAVYP